jgi:signal transduction histidine kinase
MSVSTRVLAARTADLVRARARAGDLAHALKTPLAVLSAKARSLQASGQSNDANDISEEVDRLQQIVARELLRARASLHAARDLSATPVRAAAERTCRAVGQLAQRSIAFHVTTHHHLVVAVNETDLLEMIGNLVDNASKWAAKDVTVEDASAPSGLAGFAVVDDGPGMTDAEIAEAMKPGVRLDEQAPGHGFGLGITQELVEAYGGELQLSRDLATGGLRASVFLPKPA